MSNKESQSRESVLAKKQTYVGTKQRLDKLQKELKVLELQNYRPSAV